MHRLQELVRLYRMGTGATKRAQILNIDRKTERKYRAAIRLAGLLEGPADELPELAALREAVASSTPPPEQERSSIEPWEDFVAQQTAKGLGPTAIHGQLIERFNNFEGSLSAVKRLHRRLKKAGPPRPDQVDIPVHTPPGQQVQIDFGYVGKLKDPATGELRKAWVFVMVLSHSRLLFARVAFRQDIETWLELHRQAFAFFGGVPRVWVPDNLKAAVVRAAFQAEEMGVLNRSYRELARHHGSTIDPTPAYAPKKKGKVESAVKYIKGAFFVPRDFTDVNDANRQLSRWLDETANVRVHGTTRRRPREVFDEVERDALLGLPDVPYVPVLWHRGTVGRNSHVAFDKRFYSVPWQLLGKDAWLRIQGNQVVVYVDDKRVAEHRRDGQTPWSTREAHLPEGRRDFAQRDPDHWYRRAENIGPDVLTYVRAVMASDEVHYPLRRVQSIVRTLESVPAQRACAAAKRASRFAAFHPDAVRRILAQNLDEKPATNGFINPSWAKAPQFARQATEFLRTLEVAHGHGG